MEIYRRRHTVSASDRDGGHHIVQTGYHAVGTPTAYVPAITCRSCGYTNRVTGSRPLKAAILHLRYRHDAVIDLDVD
ncbi:MULTISPECIES: hypothetical protein [unclassified Nocardia]|uniref:hypothetical protein n=1 Tax=unclassified Nocardia TaxID=2637762 RepID=UPI0024A7D79D|nr:MULTISPECIES: hypothetical protein [unclassified Nocardia]